MATLRRTRQAGQSRRISRRALLKSLAAAGVGAAGGTGAYGYLYARHALEVTRTELTVRGLSPALSGLRIGLLTDIHRSRWVSADDILVAVQALMRETPDLIVLGGDYVTWGDRRAEVPDRGRHRPSGCHDAVREPRHRHGVRPGADQLPA